MVKLPTAETENEPYALNPLGYTQTATTKCARNCLKPFSDYLAFINNMKNVFIYKSAVL